LLLMTTALTQNTGSSTLVKGAMKLALCFIQGVNQNIFNKEGWLSHSEIHAGLKLLKGQFPFVGGLADPSLNGDIVSLETHEFVQVIDCGDHWVSISTFPGMQ